jgi:hypothetical protein
MNDEQVMHPSSCFHRSSFIVHRSSFLFAAFLIAPLHFAAAFFITPTDELLGGLTFSVT